MYNECNSPVQKNLNIYVSAFPIPQDEANDVLSLLKQFPMGSDYGLLTRKWDMYYPSTQWFGVMVGYYILNEKGQRLEALTPYDVFDINNVPWEDVI